MSSTAPTQDPYRLPTNVKPLHYDLVIKTDLEALKFEGHVTVDLEVKEETNQIVFNAASLELDKATLHSGTEKIQISEQCFDKDLDRVTVKLAASLPANSRTKLKVPFKAPLTGEMTGYYFSQTEMDGEKVRYSVTKFQPSDARKAFPCWDEPALKATYDITMISREATVNLSNMPAVFEKTFVEDSDSVINDYTNLFSNLKIEGPGAGWKVTKFETTPLISTYLVAYASGPFECIEGSYTSPISGKVRPVRMYATKEIIHQAKFALDVNIRSLSLYESVFEVEFPLPKLDTLVAHDFIGAMENWGLIIGDTTSYLIDEGNSDTATEKRVAIVASHEVAHQWFGNITSPEWWDVLYLNEGFATLASEFIALDKLFPHWGAKTEFIKHIERALALDARRSSHPIEVPCDDPKKINQIFDALSYSKAGSVLRMLSDFVTEEKFLKGVSLYLKGHLYNSARTVDLWEAVSRATGTDIPNIMDNWINKIGFPVVTVTEKLDSITIRQDRYLETGDVTEEENQTLWKIPLNLLTTDATGRSTIGRSLVLTKREETYNVDTSRPYKLNTGTSGVYRVLYPPERIAKLGKQAYEQDTPLSITDRIGLISDVMVLAKSGMAATSAGLGLINEMRSETEYLVWNNVSSRLSDITGVWWEMSDATCLNMNAFRRSLFSPLAEKLGYDYRSNDSYDDHQLRTLAIGEAADAEDEEVLAELQSRFRRLVENGDHSRINPDIQETTYVHSVRKGGRPEWEVAKQIFSNPATPTARIHAIYAMTRTQDPILIDETFKFMLSDVKSADLLYFFRGFNLNRKTHRQCFSFLKENFDTIYKHIEVTFVLGGVIQAALKNFATQEDLDAITEFFKAKEITKYKMMLEQSIDAIRANITWLKRSNSDLTDWLKKWAADNSCIPNS